MTTDNRIFFKGNPWPEGHPIKEFVWTVETRGKRVRCFLHLRSADYYSERQIEDEEDVLSNWECPGSWSGYHGCILSSTHWGHAGFDLCSVDDFTAKELDRLTVNFDPHPEGVEDVYDLAMGIYLQGHDSCGKHKLTFTRIGQSNRFNIDWSGKIAKTYFGEDEFKYSFSANIQDVALPELKATPELLSEAPKPQRFLQERPLSLWQRLFTRRRG